MSSRNAVLPSSAVDTRRDFHPLRLLVAGLALAVVASTSPASAGAPNDITLQGRLFDNAGDPLPGPANLTVRIYDQLVGGTLVFLEDHPGTNLEDGTFSILIGTGSVLVGSLDADTFAEVNRFLELIVDGDSLAPRQPFSSVAYALQSQAAESAVSAEFIGSLGEGDIQRVLSASCSAGTFLQGIAADGTVDCQPDSQGSGDVTAVTAGTGLTGGGASGSVTLTADTTYLQRRVSSTCAAGSSIRAISSTGMVTCETDDLGLGDITAVTAGTGLTGGGVGGAVTLNLGTHSHGTTDVTYGCGTYAPASFCPNSLNNTAGPNCDDVPAGAFCEADGECGLAELNNCPSATEWYFKVSE